MKISIVTISFNQALFIEKTINSILNQDYEDLEYIIVDPGSTDQSRDIINKYKNKITKTIYEADEGPVDGLRKGFNVASGEVYGFVNSDDLLLPGALNKVANFFIKNPSTDVLLGNGYKIDENNFVTKKFITDIFTVNKFIYGKSNFIQPSMFFKRECFKDAGGFNINNKTCWDAELLLDFARNNKRIDYINEYLSAFRIHAQSITGSAATKKNYLADMDRMFFKIKNRDKQWYDSIFQYHFSFLNVIQNPQKMFRSFFLPGNIDHI